MPRSPLSRPLRSPHRCSCSQTPGSRQAQFCIGLCFDAVSRGRALEQATFLWCKQSSWILFSQRCDTAAPTPTEKPRIYSENRLVDATTSRKSRFFINLFIVFTQQRRVFQPMAFLAPVSLTFLLKILLDEIPWNFNRLFWWVLLLFLSVEWRKNPACFFYSNVASALPITTKKTTTAVFCGWRVFLLERPSSWIKSCVICNYFVFCLFTIVAGALIAPALQNRLPRS